MSDPRVSVLVPAYKRADTIVAAVRSALEQTLTDLEVVVVDDCSQDGTQGLLARIDDPRLVVLEHETNRGGNAARKSAIDASRGEYLAFLDADDLWMPTKLEKQVASLESCDGGEGAMAGLSYTWYDLRYPDGRLETGRRPRTEGRRCVDLLQRNVIGTFSCVMVRREVIDAVGIPDPSLPACQDWEFYLRVNERYAMTCVPEVLVHYWRDDSDAHRISSSAARVAEGHRQVYSRIVERLNALPPRESSAGRRYFIEMFANHADVRSVANVATDIRTGDLTLDDIRWIARMMARAVRKSAPVFRVPR